MIRFLRSAFLAVLFTLVFISCNQDPSSVGSNLISQQDQFTFKQYDSQLSDVPQNTSYFPFTPKLGPSEYVLLGKTPYAEASMMYRYQIILPDSTLANVNSGAVHVKEVWIETIPRYTIGDKSAPFDFVVHQIRSDWTAPGFDRDSIPALKYDAADVKSNLVITDTTLNFHINPSVVKEWLNYEYNGSAPKNNGIVLKTTPNTQKALGFLAVQAGSSTYETYMHLVLEKPNYYLDTLVVPPDEDIHFVTSTMPPAGNDLYLEGSYSLRGTVYLDISAIPKDVIINKAQLNLTADVANEYDGSLKSDSIFVQVLKDSTTKDLADSVHYGVLARKNNVFSGDVTWAVQKWVTGTANEGLYISLFDETSSLARIALYGSKNSNKALRPSLKITYMQKK